MRRVIIILILALFLSGGIFNLALAQSQKTPNLKSDKDFLNISPKNKSFSLFDPSKLQISHSYSFSYISSKNNSQNVGLYMTTLDYQVSSPLSLRLSLGYLYQPLSPWGENNSISKGSFRPNFQLLYQPNKKFSLFIDIRSIPYYYDPYRSRDWWYRDW